MEQQVQVEESNVRDTHQEDEHRECDFGEEEQKGPDDQVKWDDWINDKDLDDNVGDFIYSAFQPTYNGANNLAPADYLMPRGQSRHPSWRQECRLPQRTPPESRQGSRASRQARHSLGLSEADMNTLLPAGVGIITLENCSFLLWRCEDPQQCLTLLRHQMEARLAGATGCRSKRAYLTAGDATAVRQALRLDEAVDAIDEGGAAADANEVHGDDGEGVDADNDGEEVDGAGDDEVDEAGGDEVDEAGPPIIKTNRPSFSPAYHLYSEKTMGTAPDQLAATAPTNLPNPTPAPPARKRTRLTQEELDNPPPSKSQIDTSGMTPEEAELAKAEAETKRKKWSDAKLWIKKKKARRARAAALSTDESVEAEPQQTEAASTAGQHVTEVNYAQAED
ncbi:hypothetical protein QBC41DRAFT_298627 [Cercophora samala]|uniref:Uncharacterized protein n=1 Tax=Cercophora samala TaxID=330535 RepID=A0AA40DGE9_9PEZI|nr:hypothetical protein QBC41DRAFT_298627 [Cercophora samala]